MHDLKRYPISIQEVVRARQRVNRYLRPTALIAYESLTRIIDAQVYVKHENHNPTGVFKIRGGINLVYQLQHLGVSGILTVSPDSSSPTLGNSGRSILTAARWLGLKSVVVVPQGCHPEKISALRDSGAEVVAAGPHGEDLLAIVDQLCVEKGYYFASPCDEPLLINGVGTGFLEIIEDLPDIDVMIVPLGCGTEAAAAITTLRAFKPGVEIIAVQAELSPAAYISWKHGGICEAPSKSAAGGIATGKAYEIPFQIYKDGLSDFVLLSDDEIYAGIGLAWYYTHNLPESAGAVAFAAAFKLRERLRGKKVVLQMSGGNATPQEILEAVKRDTFSKGYLG